MSVFDLIKCVRRGMTRWGEFDDLHHIDELEEAESTNLEDPPEGSVPFNCVTAGAVNI